MFRRFAHLREKLVPYLAASARDAVGSGEPLMRGLFCDHADDPATWEHPLQFLIGRDLLVSPVVEPGVSSWSTYLPTGDWVDVWTGAYASGGQVITRDVPIDEVPVYARVDRWPSLSSLFAS